MKNYKKIIFFILAAVLVILPGCSSDTDEDVEFSHSRGLDKNGYWEGVKALDHVELFNYQEMPISSDIHEVADEDLENEINNLLNRYTTDEEIKDRPVEDGDKVNIFYVGTVDGVEFEGGSTQEDGTAVTIGVTSYIDDFLEQLIGHSPGDTIDVEVTFPEDYHEESLQGKDALFVTTINHIIETIKPDLTDDFVKTSLSEDYGWESVEEVRAGIKSDLQRVAIESYLMEYLVTEVDIKSVPEKILKYQEDSMIDYYENYAEEYDMEMDEFLEEYAYVSSIEELIETYEEDNVKNAKYSLVAQAVAEDLKLTVSEEDIVKYFVDFTGDEDYSSVADEFGLPYLKMIVLYQKVFDYIVDNAVLM